MYIVLLLAGLALTLFGADWLTDGAAVVARRFRISDFVVGMTVIAIGTSTPELAVSLLSSLEGHAEMAVGNVVGSNIFNIFVVVAACALIRPIALTRSNIHTDIPTCVGVSLLFLACGLHGSIERPVGAAMVVGYGLLLWYTVRTSRPGRDAATAEPTPAAEPRNTGGWLTALMIVGGLCALIGGGEMFVSGASELARRLGVSESVIAITIVAGGTSMPELASSVASLVKGRGAMALGNAIGSNTANILLVLGASATARPLTFGAIGITELCMVLASAVLLLLTAFTFRRRAVDRWEGAIFLIIYTAYIVWLIRTDS